MGAIATGAAWFGHVRRSLNAYLANDDPLAAIANSGAFLVWSSQPLYPLYVWLIVGRDAWPALLTWLSTPFFVAVAVIGRRYPLASRALFCVAGLLNTLLSAKAFGPGTSVAWFLVPCGIIAAAFFRRAEWRVSATLVAATAAAVWCIPHLGAPFHIYSKAQARSLSHLNLWSVAVLSAYLLYAAVQARRPPTSGRQPDRRPASHG